MPIPGRTFSSGSYCYGFNGKENDNEVKGTGNQQDYGMRIFDPRLGRFLSVDLLTTSYPHYTPYSFAGNKPIWATDLDGLEENTTSTFSKRPTSLFITSNYYTVNLKTVSISLTSKNTIGDPKAGIPKTSNFITVGEKTFALPQGVSPEVALSQLYDRTGDVRTGQIRDVGISSYYELLRSTVTYSPKEIRDIRISSLAAGFNENLQTAVNHGLMIAAPVQMAYEEAGVLGGSKGGSVVTSSGIEETMPISRSLVTPQIQHIPFNKVYGSVRRFMNFSTNWQSSSLSASVNELTGGAEGVFNAASGKVTYKNANNGMSVVHDVVSDYFTIQNQAGEYLGLGGKPINVGNLRGKAADNYIKANTHFINTDQ